MPRESLFSSVGNPINYEKLKGCSSTLTYPARETASLISVLRLFLLFFACCGGAYILVAIFCSLPVIQHPVNFAFLSACIFAGLYGQPALTIRAFLITSAVLAVLVTYCSHYVTLLQAIAINVIAYLFIAVQFFRHYQSVTRTDWAKLMNVRRWLAPHLTIHGFFDSLRSWFFYGEEGTQAPTLKTSAAGSFNARRIQTYAVLLISLATLPAIPMNISDLPQTLFLIVDRANVEQPEEQTEELLVGSERVFQKSASLFDDISLQSLELLTIAFVATFLAPPVLFLASCFLVSAFCLGSCYATKLEAHSDKSFPEVFQSLNQRIAPPLSKVRELVE